MIASSDCPFVAVPTGAGWPVKIRGRPESTPEGRAVPSNERERRDTMRMRAEPDAP